MAKEQKQEDKEKQYDTYKRGTADPAAAEATNTRGLLNMIDRLINKPKYYKKGGKIDGCAVRGKTRGRIV